MINIVSGSRRQWVTPSAGNEFARAEHPPWPSSLQHLSLPFDLVSRSILPIQVANRSDPEADIMSVGVVVSTKKNPLTLLGN